MLAALIGLLIIGLSLGGSITVVGFTLTLASAVSWAIGNVLVKRLPKTNMLHLMVWASLVPPLPALGISCILDGPQSLIQAVAAAPWLGICAPIYLGLLASVLAYAVWGNLLHQYPTGAVAPFALLSPCVGAVASAFVFGERFSAPRLAGMACILLGVAIVVFPLHGLHRLAMAGLVLDDVDLSPQSRLFVDISERSERGNYSSRIGAASRAVSTPRIGPATAARRRKPASEHGDPPYASVPRSGTTYGPSGITATAASPWRAMEAATASSTIGDDLNASDPPPLLVESRSCRAGRGPTASP